ncbi:MAG: hypothetical protein ACE5JL_19905, partial [Dehalococcoidia bacterium]
NQRYGWPVSHEGDLGSAFGTPEDCIRTIERFISAGVEHFVLNFASPHNEVVPQVERFALEVMPHFRS